jgi:hypothetical protein
MNSSNMAHRIKLLGNLYSDIKQKLPLIKQLSDTTREEIINVLDIDPGIKVLVGKRKVIINELVYANELVIANLGIANESNSIKDMDIIKCSPLAQSPLSPTLLFRNRRIYGTDRITNVLIIDTLRVIDLLSITQEHAEYITDRSKLLGSRDYSSNQTIDYANMCGLSEYIINVCDEYEYIDEGW